MKTCENCGERVYSLGCSNCDEPNYIAEQVRLTPIEEIGDEAEPKRSGAMRPEWRSCKTHGDIDGAIAWGCPECVRELRMVNGQLRKVLLAALRQVGCDGDLCAYEWHEEARRLLADEEQES